MAEGLHGGRRPRPVADVPPPALADGEAAAKAWLLALVAARPLATVADLPAVELARDAPGLCAGVLAAVGSDHELEALAPGGESADLPVRAARLAGASTPSAVVAAVAGLRAALWEVLEPELDRRDGELAAAVALRLGYVCDAVVQTALARPGRGEGPLADALREQGGGGEARRGVLGVVGAPEPAPGGDPLGRPWTDPLGRIAERAAPRPAPADRDEWEPRPGAPPAGGPEPGDDRGEPSGPDEPAPEEPGAPGDAAARPGLGAVAEPPDRDEGAGPAAAERPEADDPLGRLAGELGEEAEGGDEPWAEAVARRAERHRADGRPFVVLAIEVDDVERLLAADRGGDAARAVARVEAALREELRTADVVLRERPGRLWVVAVDVATAGARALGERLAAAAGSAALHATPLTVSIGFAACPADGTDAAALVAHAEEGVYAARAAGVRLA